jgi:hypothetical protein
LTIALAELNRRAATIPDPVIRQRFLEQPRDNARILSLANEHGLSM